LTKPDDPTHARIDAALAEWRQGDCVLEGEHWFVHRRGVDPQSTGEEAVSVVESEVPGFVVLTQSCDVVRKYKDRPFVAVSPLAQVSDDDLGTIVKGRRPQFVAIPAILPKKLVADLDRVMTVDKQVVAGWPRTKGCTNDGEVREFSRAVARKHARFAFPNDFNEFAADLDMRIREKHGKQSEEGAALRDLEEIRVRAAPSWEAAEVELTFWFIAKPKAASDLRKSGVLRMWDARVPAKGRFKRVFSQITTYEELTAEDYLDSDRLDLDHLSAASA